MNNPFAHFAQIITSLLLAIVPCLYLVIQLIQYNKPKTGVVGNSTAFPLDTTQIAILLMFSLAGVGYLIVSIAQYRKRKDK